MLFKAKISQVHAKYGLKTRFMNN